MIALHVFSSVGIGLLVGFLLGLSASPVVGLVVGSITALLASLLGIQSPKNEGKSHHSNAQTNHNGDLKRQLIDCQKKSELLADALEKSKLIALRSGIFGLTCVVGILAGIYMRTHNMLSPPAPTLKQQYEELKSLDFSPLEARNLLITHLAKDSQKSSKTATAKDTVLFSIDSKICDTLNSNRFSNLAAATSYYRSFGYEHIAEMAERIQRFVPEEKIQQDLMNSIVSALCEQN